MNIVTYFFVALSFCVAGIIIGELMARRGRPDGILGIDTRDPNKDFYDFVILTPTGTLQKKKYLKIEVKLK